VVFIVLQAPPNGLRIDSSNTGMAVEAVLEVDIEDLDVLVDEVLRSKLRSRWSQPIKRYSGPVVCLL